MTPSTPHPYSGLEPVELWRHFALLNQTPRPSGHEAASVSLVMQEAAQAGARWKKDDAGNIVVYVPARNGGDASAPVVAIQSHLDMVCEKRPDVTHDFNLDPIRPRRNGDVITATGTTLGADNGIGAAAALAFLTTPGLKHGPLELLFTVEEETGLYGAMGLDASLLSAQYMINLDSEDPAELTIGCAGGAGTTLHLPIAWEMPPSGWQNCAIVVSGLKGGHSGVQIHEPLANAIKLLAETLELAIEEGGEADAELRIAAVSGGTAHNAIPRDAVATIIVSPGNVPSLETAVRRAQETLDQRWSAHEPNFALEVKPATAPTQVMTRKSGTDLLELLSSLPHGVQTMSDTFEGKVETSTNLCAVETTETEVAISTSTRSFVNAELQKTQAKIQVLGAEVGATAEVRDGYPGWEPDADSKLLRITEEVYAQVMGKPAQVQVIHAGLECGVIVSKMPDLEAISFGPLIRGAHTPEESVTISSTQDTWKLLVALLAALS